MQTKRIIPGFRGLRIFFNSSLISKENSYQFDQCDFRKYSYPSRVTDKSITPVHI